MHVLKKSPADKTGLEPGDELVSIADARITKPQDIDAALAPFQGTEKVEVVVRRKKKKETLTAKLVERGDYRGDFLKRQGRGRTGFQAPEWFVYAWAEAGKEPPTRANTKGKVVVIHCYQSW
jgi:predicted metalloprotease with PDZ domain